jgi:hypothetical protein
MIRVLLFSAALATLGAGSAAAADWLLAPSTYTHDPQNGQRTAQYAPIAPVLVPTRADYLKSGYRHNRSSIFSGDGSDNQHIVEQWGRPVRPYGEWLYPYRPYSVPYQLWGPPYAGLGWPYRSSPRQPHPHGGFHNHQAAPPAQPEQRWPDGEPEPAPTPTHPWGGASGPT